ncbi:phosphatidylinositol kinase Tor2 [Thecamonas trahens ATCC 50062]|uniref:Serine/threonine-protein kinase TOR n=1 Tax=Thecamonas trahens ATCC 50062 TaxID=461836 RepID=A0A0L0DH95_THETB|nr:phosphatidylinositol kinase Tor2 [Thecamonas trahens ATCC 50062]KNC51511.1 phosphatidylinositol kinase Tor2 [Thecamonas trahens ATCC 50062]|eukprot:XP_013755914.1 phosphatidylinositol kinase Tor2 [Thecamonas trahens ATCC 50062]
MEGIFRDLEDPVREAAAGSLREFVNVALKRERGESLTDFLNSVYAAIHGMMVGSALRPASKLGGVLAISALLEIEVADNALKVTRFANLLKNCMPRSSPEVMAAAAATLGKLVARSNTILQSDLIVEFEVNRALEWLMVSRVAGHRLAAVLTLRVLVRAAPAQFFKYTTLFFKELRPLDLFDCVWEGIIDDDMAIREVAAELLASILLALQPRSAAGLTNFARRAFTRARNTLIFSSSAIPKKKLAVLSNELEHYSHVSAVLGPSTIIIADTPTGLTRPNSPAPPAGASSSGGPTVSSSVLKSPSAVHGALMTMSHIVLLTGSRFVTHTESLTQAVVGLRDARLVDTRMCALRLSPLLAALDVATFVSLHLKKVVKSSLSILKRERDKSSLLRSVTLLALGDLALAVQHHITPYLKDIMGWCKTALTLKKRASSVCLQALTTVARLATALGPSFLEALTPNLDALFGLGLSEELIDTVLSIATDLPDLADVAFYKLLDLVSLILAGAPFRHPGTPAHVATHSHLEPLLHSPQFMGILAASQSSTAAKVLALKTLSMFDFVSYFLHDFLEGVVFSYLEDPEPVIRKQAAITICKLISQPSQATSPQFVHRILKRLLIVCVSDREPEVRLEVLRQLFSGSPVVYPARLFAATRLRTAGARATAPDGTVLGAPLDDVAAAAAVEPRLALLFQEHVLLNATFPTGLVFRDVLAEASLAEIRNLKAASASGPSNSPGSGATGLTSGMGTPLTVATSPVVSGASSAAMASASSLLARGTVAPLPSAVSSFLILPAGVEPSAHPGHAYVLAATGRTRALLLDMSALGGLERSELERAQRPPSPAGPLEVTSHAAEVAALTKGDSGGAANSHPPQELNPLAEPGRASGETGVSEHTLDLFLAQEDNLRAFFFTVNDPVLRIREMGLRIVGRLSTKNPAYVLPAMRSTLMRLLTLLELSLDPVTREEAAHMLGILIHACPAVAKHYVQPIMKRLLPMLADGDNPLLNAHVLRAIGECCHVGGSQLTVYVHTLLPLLMKALSDSSSTVKRYVALRTLGDFVVNTGTVIQPYIDYPHLLTTLLNVLKTSQQVAIRRLVIKVIGSLGALDPFVIAEQARVAHEQASSKRAKPKSGAGSLALTSEGGGAGGGDGSGTGAPPPSEEEQELPLASQLRLLSPSSGEYYEQVAVACVMYVLKSSTLARHHKLAVSALMQIFHSIGMNKTAPFLKEFIPVLFPLIRSCEPVYRESLFQNLSTLVHTVKQHIRPFLPQLFDLVVTYWDASIVNQLVALVEEISIILPDDFKSFLPRLLPRLLGMLEAEPVFNGPRILAGFQTFGSALDHYADLVLEAIIHMFESELVPVRTRLTAVQTLGSLLLVHNFSAHASRIIHALLAVIEGGMRVSRGGSGSALGVIDYRGVGAGGGDDGSVSGAGGGLGLSSLSLSMSFASPVGGGAGSGHLSAGPGIGGHDGGSVVSGKGDDDGGTGDGGGSGEAGAGGLSSASGRELIQSAVWVLGVFAAHLGKQYKIFLPAITSTFTHLAVHNEGFDGLARALTVGAELPESLPWSRATGLDETEATLRAGTRAPGKMTVSTRPLLGAWRIVQVTTKEEWMQWIRRVSVMQLKQSSAPALRACGTMAQSYYPLARQLFNAAFLSCWTELDEGAREKLVRCVRDALDAPIPAEILQQLLNLAEYMDRNSQALPIPIRSLGELAVSCRAYAKALRYKELEYEAQEVKDVALVEELIAINHQLQDAEAASGVLVDAKRYHNIELNSSMYETLGQWNNALAEYQSLAASDPLNAENLVGMMRCHSALGEWSAVDSLSQSVYSSSPEEARRLVAPLAATAAWSLGAWDQAATYISQLDPGTVEGAFFHAVLAVHKGEYPRARAYIELARDVLSTQVVALVDESYNRAYSLLVRVQQLAELEEVIAYKECESPEVRSLRREVWVKRLYGVTENVQVWQQLLAVRSLALKPEEQEDVLVRFASICLSSKHISLSHQTLVSLLAPHASPASGLAPSKPWVSLAALRNMWASGEREAAIAALSEFVQHITDDSEALAQAYLDLGKWKKAVMLDGGGRVEAEAVSGILHAFHAATAYYMEWYEAWHEWGMMNAELIRAAADAEAGVGAGSGAAAAAGAGAGAGTETGIGSNGFGSGGGDELELSSSVSSLELSDSDEDGEELGSDGMGRSGRGGPLRRSGERVRSGSGGSGSTVIKYVVAAVQGFVRAICMRQTDVLPDLLRLVTLWFTYGHESKVLELVQASFVQIPSRIWLNVVPQIIARIHNTDAAVSASIHTLLSSLAREHPQALVFPLWVAAKSQSAERVAAAEALLNGMRAHSALLVDEAALVSQELIRVSILWAELWFEGIDEASRCYFGHKDLNGMLEVLTPLHRMMAAGPRTTNEVAFVQSFGKPLKDAYELVRRYMVTKAEDDLTRAWDSYLHVFRQLQQQLPLQTSFNLEHTSPELRALSGLSLAVPGVYRAGEAELARIESFVPTVAIIQSKQRPRQLSIRGSDGLRYRYLLKGHEDLRQDARAMQLFHLVNLLLGTEAVTARKRLSIETYEVIPLSPNSGLLWWVADYDTFHSLMKEYRRERRIPLDKEHAVMRDMGPSKFDTLTVVQKLEAFEAALEATDGKDLANIFWLKSPNAEVWYEKRLAYTQSLAVMSMVGYVLGLGDRHPSNIMFDRWSGKVLHVDYGDCFEVAMLRERYAEKVPFRLTRFMVNAMHVAGIEGNFRATCEDVMELLRNNRDSLMAVLEAFIHDPLVSWRLNVDAGAGGTDLNAKARRVVDRVADKLVGRDFDPGVKLGVSEQVDRLIRDATAHENLCVCFQGWCAPW